jgi:hypothetical protein
VLRHFGVRIRTIACRVGVFNEAMLLRVDREGRWPTDPGETERWSRQDGSWGVSIGTTGQMIVKPDGMRRYDGHLVLLAHPQAARDEESDHGGVLIDLTLHQASRPQKGIQLDPLIATVGKDFLYGGPYSTVVNGCGVRYDYMPESMDWVFTPDWRDTDRRVPIIRRSIERMEAALDGA